MVALLLRLVVLLLAMLAAGWAAWWIPRGQALVGVLGALALLLLPAWVLAFEFVFVPLANRTDPAPRARSSELLWAWWNESWLAFRVFAWQMPFRSHAHPDHVNADSHGRPGLLLVHGFMCNRGVWNGWLPRLRARGVAFIAPSLEPAFGSIDAYAAAIDDAVRRLREATGVAPLIVEQMAQMIIALKRQGVSILLCEQNMHFAELVSDRAYVLEKGQIRWQGTMAALAADDAVRRAYLSM